MKFEDCRELYVVHIAFNLTILLHYYYLVRHNSIEFLNNPYPAQSDIEVGLYLEGKVVLLNYFTLPILPWFLTARIGRVRLRVLGTPGHCKERGEA